MSRTLALTPECPPWAARCSLQEKECRKPTLPPCKQRKPGWNRISGLRFPRWLHSAALPIGQASCLGFSNRGSDTHLLPDWPGCAAVPWQRGQRDQSLQDDLSHHPTWGGTERHLVGKGGGCKEEQVLPTSSRSQVGDRPPQSPRLVGFPSFIISWSIFPALLSPQSSCVCRRKARPLTEVNSFAQSHENCKPALEPVLYCLTQRP